jgi:hypothetical protein
VRPDQRAVWSKPITQYAEYQDAELGATGLGLVALAAAREARPEAVSLEQLQSLGRFLLFLQRDDGSFVNKYRLKTGPVPSWQSLYYPGEAALGLLAIYEAITHRYGSTPLPGRWHIWQRVAQGSPQFLPIIGP